jgi:ribosomal-protein-alanine N-acetyltransferase
MTNQLPGVRGDDWRALLPTLTAQSVTLREPAPQDAAAVLALLCLADATTFSLEDAATDASAEELLHRAVRDRTLGQAFTYAVTAGAAHPVIGLIQVRSMDPAFEAARWECTLAPSARGTGIFIDSIRLVGAFAFASVGVRRLEARVLRQNGPANTALRKIGAVEEGVLRRSARVNGEYVDQVLWSLLRDDWGGPQTATGLRVH